MSDYLDEAMRNEARLAVLRLKSRMQGKKVSTRSVALSDDDVEYALRLGNGNLSAGIRLMIAYHRKANSHNDEPLA